MNFLSPIGFAFAAALPVVVVFYLLKRKRVAKVVPSTLLWQRFLAETQANAPFQRLRHNWLLILQLLLLAMLVLALARPYLAAKTQGGRILVTILDASASMQSTDETPTRFDTARRQALELVQGMQDSDQMVVLQAGASTEVRQSPTSDKGLLRKAIEGAKAVDSPTRLSEALKLGETLIQNQRSPEIHLFSDGAVGDLSEFENKRMPLTFHRVGQRGMNAGIINLEARQNPENPTQRAIFATVANYSTNKIETRLLLKFGGQLVDTKQVTLGPRESAPKVFVTAQDRDGVFTVDLDFADDLASDNTASVVSLLPRPVKVLLVTAGNRFLEKALKSVALVELSTVSQITGASDSYDLVVLDNIAPIQWPEGNVLAFNVAATNWFGQISKNDSPGIVDWRAGHPLLRFVSFDNVQVSEALSVTTPAWGQALVDSPHSPLMVAGERGKQRVVWVGFDSLQSTWPLRISFPIFIANAVDWLNPFVSASAQLAVKSGEPFRAFLPGNAMEAEITRPGGLKRTIKADPVRKEILFGETDRRGIYEGRAGTNQFTFCVNLLSSAESDTTPADELKIGHVTQEAASKQRTANTEFWRWLALTALLICLFEWWYYHRRTA